MSAGSSRAVGVRVPKAADLIARSLRRQIVSGELPEGTALPAEAALLSEFEVSRPTLREAYRVLESEGLITVRRGARGGAFVHQPTADAAARYAALVLQSEKVLLRDIYDARRVLEDSVVSLVQANPNADLSVLRAINDDAAASANDLLKMLEHHHRFHQALLEMSGNRTLVLFSRMMELILEAANIRHVSDRITEEAAATGQAQRTHVQIVELMESGRSDKAQELWRSHLQDSAAHVLTNAEARTALEYLP